MATPKKPTKIDRAIDLVKDEIKALERQRFIREQKIDALSGHLRELEKIADNPDLK